MAWLDKVAIITGASSGIGLATAKRLAQEGLRVALVARRKNLLDTLATQINQRSPSTALPIQADLTLEADRQRVIDTVHHEWGSVDILINSAGFGWYGYLWYMPWRVAADMLHVNIEALTHLTLLVLDEMKKRDAGAIINIGSIIGDLHVQGSALYAATKSYLDAFSTALYREMRTSNVHISLIKAGPVATEFFNVSEKIQNGKRIPAERYAIPPERVADKIWHTLNHPKPKVYIPRWTAIIPGVELLFSWILNLAGPVLLKS